jgi:high-affinity K+ transport system ATPase subunit B
MSTPKTSGQRQAEFIARMKASGMKSLKGLWVHAGDVDAMRAHAETLAKRREREIKRAARLAAKER